MIQFLLCYSGHWLPFHWTLGAKNPSICWFSSSEDSEVMKWKAFSISERKKKWHNGLLQCRGRSVFLFHNLLGFLAVAVYLKPLNFKKWVNSDVSSWNAAFPRSSFHPFASGKILSHNWAMPPQLCHTTTTGLCYSFLIYKGRLY